MASPDPRVLFVSAHSSDGGSEGHLRRLLARLDPSWVAEVVCLQGGPLVQRLRDDGWRVQVMATGAHPVAILRSARRLRAIVAGARPDVIHANGVKAAIVAVLSRCGVPVVWNKHDHAYDGPIGRAVAARCAAVVGVSGSSVQQVRSAAKRVVVVPPLVDPPVADARRGRSQLTQLAGCDAQSLLVVCVGRLERAKGQLDVVEALAALRERSPDLDVRLLLVGGPQPKEPDHAQLVLACVHRLGMEDAVRLVGFRADALDLIAGADALVVASHPVDRRGMGAEGYGLVAVEAMALGTPVVAYAAGALPEVVGECGELVPVRDRDALSRALDAVLSDPTRVETMVEHARQRAAPIVEGTRTVQGLSDVYRDVSGGPYR